MDSSSAGAPALQQRPGPSAPLEQFQQDLNRVLQEYGLHGGADFVGMVTKSLGNAVAEARKIEESRARDRENANQTLTLFQARRSRLDRFNFWPVNLFTRGGVRARAEDLGRLQRRVGEAQRLADESAATRAAWSTIQKTIDPLGPALAERVELLVRTRTNQIQGDMSRLFGTTRTAEHQPFELFTMVLGKEYIEQTLYPDVLRKGLARQLSSDRARALRNPYVCSAQLVTASEVDAGTGTFAETLQLSYTDEHLLAGAIEAIARSSARQYLPSHTFHIREILKTRNPHVDNRLRDLFVRCQPFWRFDLDIGGHSEDDMEEIILAGLHDTGNKEWKYLLRDFPAFTRVETDDPTRIDACRVVHGLPVEFLKALPEMRTRYDQFHRDQMGPLQLDAHWERGCEGALPEISPAAAIVAEELARQDGISAQPGRTGDGVSAKDPDETDDDSDGDLSPGNIPGDEHILPPPPG